MSDHEDWLADSADREWVEDRRVPNPAAYSADDLDRMQRALWEGEARRVLYPDRAASAVTNLGGPGVPLRGVNHSASIRPPQESAPADSDVSRGQTHNEQESS